MTYLPLYQVPNPNVFDPNDLMKSAQDIKGPMPDFFIWYNHPVEIDQIGHIPCRELDDGEQYIFETSLRQKLPKWPKGYENIRIIDYNAEQQAWYTDYLAKKYELECERNIQATMKVILDDRWQEAHIRQLLSKRAHRSAFLGGTAKQRERDPVVTAFLGAGYAGAQTYDAEVPPDTIDE